jgi:hypothetical protein
MGMLDGANPGARYVRGNAGKTVHKAECTRIGRVAVPWNYADDYDADQILAVIANYAWLKPCQACKPDREAS